MSELVKRKLCDFWLQMKLNFQALDTQGKFGVALLIVVILTNLIAFARSNVLVAIGLFLFEVACLISALLLGVNATKSEKEVLVIGLSLTFIFGFWSLYVVVHPIATLALAFYFIYFLLLEFVRTEYARLIKEMDQGNR